MRVHSQQTHRSEPITAVFRTSFNVTSRVTVGPGCLSHMARVVAQLELGKTALILAQPSTMKQFAKPVEEWLTAANHKTKLLELPDGEACKSHETLLQVWSEMQALQMQRSDVLIAVGGGALTDLAGFAASTYLRGIKLILVPTTLLAQVDASIGGKTGINLPSGKNLAGTFYFPEAVVVDPDVLTSLPERDLRSGLGEIIKYALIEDTIAADSEYRRGPRSMFSLLKDSISEETGIDEAILNGIISACIKMKLAVVAKDPHEQRFRRSLNLGHTLGHAIEKVANFKYSHGEAVAIGLVFACRLAERHNAFPSENTMQLIALLKQAGLPTEPPAELDKNQLISAMAFDKKREGDKIRWVLPREKLGVIDLDVTLSTEQVRALL